MKRFELKRIRKSLENNVYCPSGYINTVFAELDRLVSENEQLRAEIYMQRIRIENLEEEVEELEEEECDD